MSAEAIGWLSSAVLLLTVGRQVCTQWTSGSTEGVSRWLFIGQVAASTGFTVYSWLLQNWIFLLSNAAMLLLALGGEMIYLRNRRLARQSPSPARIRT